MITKFLVVVLCVGCICIKADRSSSRKSDRQYDEEEEELYDEQGKQSSSHKTNHDPRSIPSFSSHQPLDNSIPSQGDGVKQSNQPNSKENLPNDVISKTPDQGKEIKTLVQGVQTESVRSQFETMNENAEKDTVGHNVNHDYSQPDIDQIVNIKLESIIVEDSNKQNEPNTIQGQSKFYKAEDAKVKSEGEQVLNGKIEFVQIYNAELNIDTKNVHDKTRVYKVEAREPSPEKHLEQEPSSKSDSVHDNGKMDTERNIAHGQTKFYKVEGSNDNLKQPQELNVKSDSIHFDNPNINIDTRTLNGRTKFHEVKKTEGDATTKNSDPVVLHGRTDFHEVTSSDQEKGEFTPGPGQFQKVDHDQYGRKERKVLKVDVLNQAVVEDTVNVEVKKDINQPKSTSQQSTQQTFQEDGLHFESVNMDEFIENLDKEPSTAKDGDVFEIENLPEPFDRKTLAIEKIKGIYKTTRGNNERETVILYNPDEFGYVKSVKYTQRLKGDGTFKTEEEHFLQTIPELVTHKDQLKKAVK
ncbi:hypothetical protein LOTGIDRAFT_230340, partial [Lottia gigantea]